jgi:hypothetical protein
MSIKLKNRAGSVPPGVVFASPSLRRLKPNGR